MRALALALALVALPAAAQPTVVESINALRADVAALKADRDAMRAEIADLKLRMNRVENSYNILTYYLLTQACYANSMQPTWLTSLTGLKPFPIADHPCPPAGEKIYVPDFIGGQSSVLKPPQQ